MNRLQPLNQSGSPLCSLRAEGGDLVTGANLFSLPMVVTTTNMMPSMKRNMMCCSTGKGQTDGMQA